MRHRTPLAIIALLLLTVVVQADERQQLAVLAARDYPHLQVSELRLRSGWAVVEFRHKKPEQGDEHSMQRLLRKDNGLWFAIELQRRGYELFPLDLVECGVPIQDIQALLGRAATKEELRGAKEHGPFFADLSTIKLPEGVGDGRATDPWSVMLMRNEIYARHGRPFQDPYLRAYYQSRPWYRSDPSFSDQRLNAVERYNVNILLKAEKQAQKALKSR